MPTSRISAPVSACWSQTLSVKLSHGAGCVLRALGDVRAPGVRQMVETPAVRLLGPDQALVLELLQRRVDRAGARAPQALGALLELLHDLVAVARLLREEQQRRGADVAAARAPAPAAAAGPAAAAMNGAAHGPKPGPPPGAAEAGAAAEAGTARPAGPAGTEVASSATPPAICAPGDEAADLVACRRMFEGAVDGIHEGSSLSCRFVCRRYVTIYRYHVACQGPG